jgi:hypothetical protein
MTRVLYIPTGIVFEVQDIYYFETLFTTDPALFYNTKLSEILLLMSHLINLIAKVDPNYCFPSDKSYYIAAVEFIQKLGRECFEIL